MIYVLSFRDESRNTGGPVVPGQLMIMTGTNVESARMGTEVDAQLLSEPRVTFLIHGFNVQRKEGRKQLLEFAKNLEPVIPGALVAILWPGDHFFGPISYSWQGDDADDTAVELEKFIDLKVAPRTDLHFIAHSLGARVGLSAIDRLLDAEADFSIGQICLMAPAVDNDSLAHGDVYRKATESADRVGVLHSTDDEVLRFAYPAGDLLQSFLFFWRDSPGFALGYRGPRAADGGNGGGVPGNVIDRAVGDHDVDHSDYLPKYEGGSNSKQKSAEIYAGDLVSGRDEPRYPVPSA